MTTITQEISREQFLKALFESFLQESEGYIETREIISGQEGANQTFHRTIDSIVNHTPTGNYYFGVCPRLRESGKEADIETIVSLWVDMDMEIEAAMKALDNFSHKPSIVVDSGHGVHAYWLLREPEQVKANTKSVLQGVAKALGADNCFDLPRILRVPGTKNLKVSSEPKDVQVIVFNPETRYNLSDFDAYEVEIQEKSEVQVNFSNIQQDVNVEELKVSKAIKKLIQEGKQEGDRYPSRSEADFAVVCALVKAGYSDDIILTTFDKYAIGAKFKEEGIGYLKHTISWARQSVLKERKSAPIADIWDLGSDGSLRLNLKKVRDNLLDYHKIIYSGGNFYEYREGCYMVVNIEIVKKWIMDLVGARLTKRGTESIIYFLQAEVFVEVEDLNNMGYLNVKNGLLDINKGILLPHSEDVYSTIQLDVNYNPSAKCEKWVQTLKEIFPFPGEEDKISDLQEFFGLCFTKIVKYAKALLLVGEGANGKSLILGVMAKLLGEDNITAIPLEKFDNHFYLVNLFGKLANISIETNAKSEVYDSMFKAVVSGDLIEAEQKFKPSFHFNPFCKLIFATNNLPRVEDRSDAYFRRLLIIRFNKQFTEREQNKNLNEELMLEIEGILIWCLEGLKRLNARGRFEEKEYLQKEIAEYRLENNNVILFVNEECTLDLAVSIQVGELYTKYVKWCEDNGCRSLQKIRFGKELKRQFRREVTKEISTNGVHIWCGIKPNFIRYTEN